MKKKPGLLVLVLFILAFQSCVSHKKLVSFKNESDHVVYDLDSVTIYKIVKGDRIGVQVINNTGEEIDVFNRQMNEVGQSSNESGAQDPMAGYDVDIAGNIDLPMIGKIYVEGKSVEEVDSIIENALKDYIAYAYVKTKLLSYRITILGEVKTPQTLINAYSNLSIVQALGLVGDFTDYANRERVKVYRKISSDKYEMYVVDMSSDNVFKQTDFYLLPNDIIYVEPLNAKRVRVNAPTISLALSVITLAFVVMNFFQF